MTANILTVLRILGSLILLFLQPLSPAFYVLYLFAGITDVLDGWIARKTGTAGELGAKLDSVADLIFYSVMLLKLMPILWVRLPGEIWWVVGAALLVRLCSYGVAAVKYHRFASLHTYLNKATGAAVFLIPFFLPFSCGVVFCWIVCAVAFTASAEELILHLTHPVYDANVKTILKQKV